MGLDMKSFALGRASAGGTELGPLMNPAGPGEILEGYEAYDEFGEAFTGEFQPDTPALEPLDNPASDTDVLVGCEAYDEDGALIVGTYEPVELDPLEHPAGAEDIRLGYEAYDENGSPIVGTLDPEAPALAPLDNPASDADIIVGCEAYDENGNLIVGTLDPGEGVPTQHYFLFDEVGTTGLSYIDFPGTHRLSDFVTIRSSRGLAGFSVLYINLRLMKQTASHTGGRDDGEGLLTLSFESGPYAAEVTIDGESIALTKLVNNGADVTDTYGPDVTWRLMVFHDRTDTVS